MEHKDLKENIIKWAESKGLLNEDYVFTQFTKTAEELGELASSLIKNDRKKTVDAIGDVLVTIIILAKQKGLDTDYCLEYAWNQIKGRTGHLSEDGSFIKDE